MLYSRVHRSACWNVVVNRTKTLSNCSPKNSFLESQSRPFTRARKRTSSYCKVIRRLVSRLKYYVSSMGKWNPKGYFTKALAPELHLLTFFYLSDQLHFTRLSLVLSYWWSLKTLEVPTGSVFISDFSRPASFTSAYPVHDTYSNSPSLTNAIIPCEGRYKKHPRNTPQYSALPMVHFRGPMWIWHIV